MPASLRSILQNKVHQPGTTIDTLAIDDDIVKVAVIIDRSDFSGPETGEVANWTVELSTNGGPFTLASQGTLRDGASVDDEGLTRIAQYWTWTIPPGINRQARVTVNVLERIRTGGELETFTDTGGLPSHAMR